jgi:hypothetical protein
LKDAFLQLLSDAKRRHKDRAAIAGCQRFSTLSDAAYDIIAWGFHFYRYPLALRRDRNAVDHRVAGAGRLH